MTIPHLFLVVLVNLIWGSLFVMATIGLEQFPPFLFTSLRFALLAVVLIPFLRIIPGQMKQVVAVSLVLGIAMYITLYMALYLSDNTASIAMLSQLEAPIAVILGIVLLGEKTNKLRTIGTVVAFGGAMLLMFDPAVLDHLDASAMIIVSVTFYAIGMILVRRLDNVSPFVLNAWMALISALPLLLLSWLFEFDQWGAAMDADLRGWGTLFYSAFVGSLIGHGGMYYLLGKYPVGVIAPFTLLTPLFAVIGSVLFLGDTLTITLTIGGLLILAGVGGVNFASRFDKTE